MSYWEAFHPHSMGGAYVNFMMEEGQERIRATYRGTGASGSMNVKDHGTGQQIKLVSVNSVGVTGNHVTVNGTCRIDKGPSESCQIDAEDNGEPGAGTDEFQLEVGGGASYSGGGTLKRGNVQIHS